jgi:hypothetical protein
MGTGSAQKLFTPEVDTSIGVVGKGVGQELENRESRHRLAGATFSHEPEGLSPFDRQGDAAHGLHLGSTPAKGDVQISDF